MEKGSEKQIHKKSKYFYSFIIYSYPPWTIWMKGNSNVGRQRKINIKVLRINRGVYCVQ